MMHARIRAKAVTVALLLSCGTGIGGISIRPATHGDAKGMLACLPSAFEPFRDRYTPDGFGDTVLRPATLERRLFQMTDLWR
jgi:hypothetical protein